MLGLIHLGNNHEQPTQKKAWVWHVQKTPFNASRIDKLLQDHVKVIVSVDGSDQARHKIVLLLT